MVKPTFVALLELPISLHRISYVTAPYTLKGFEYGIVSRGICGIIYGTLGIENTV